MWHRNSTPLTAADKDFIARAKLSGCLPCWLNTHGLGMCATNQRVEFNHHLQAGKRMGHQFGSAECVWHHQGEPRDGWAKATMLQAYGPSRKYQGAKGAFAATYGSDEELRELQVARADKLKGLV